MRSASAWAPGNISCIFEICKGRTPATTGSRGLGFTIDKGARVKVSKAQKNIVTYNNKKVKFPTVELVIEKLTKGKIRAEIFSPLPLGAGFGMSGACALAAAYALNTLLALGKSKKELAMAAHCAEVEAGTGLGDVVNQFYGGFLAKLEPSWKFKVTKMRNSGKKIHCMFFSKISTKGVIGNERKKKMINKAGAAALSSLEKMIKGKKNIPLAQLITLSRIFAEESNLLRDTRVKRIIKDVEKRGGHASMIMLGNAVFSDLPFKGSMAVRISRRGAN